MSCPSVALCVVVDTAGEVMTSTSPQSAGPWSLVQLAGSPRLDAVSCPTVSFCVATGAGVFISTDPTGGANTWISQGVANSNVLVSVSCASTTQCVAVNVSPPGALVSSEPMGGASAWQAVSWPGSGTPAPEMSVVTCPSTHLCVAAGHYGKVEVSSDPAGGASSWHESVADPKGGSPGGQSPNSLVAISCPTVRSCTALDTSGGVVTTTSPAGSWNFYDLPTVSSWISLSCSAPSVCLGIGTSGTAADTIVRATSKATAGPGGWSTSLSQSSFSFELPTCTPTSQCFVLRSDATAYSGALAR